MPASNNNRVHSRARGAHIAPVDVMSDIDPRPPQPNPAPSPEPAPQPRPLPPDGTPPTHPVPQPPGPVARKRTIQWFLPTCFRWLVYTATLWKTGRHHSAAC